MKPRLIPREQVPQQDLGDPINPETMLHVRERGRTWWGEPLPWIEREGQSSRLADVGWWTQARFSALALWLDCGEVRNLAALATGTPEDRRKHVEQSVEASLAVYGDTPQPVPDRISAGAYRMEQLAEIVDPGAGRIPCRVFAKRSVVERAISLHLFRRHADPRFQVRTKTLDETGREVVTLETILPDVRKVIDHDQRMRDAEDTFTTPNRRRE